MSKPDNTKLGLLFLILIGLAALVIYFFFPEVIGQFTGYTGKGSPFVHPP